MPTTPARIRAASNPAGTPVGDTPPPSSPFDDPRVAAVEYIVRPTMYDQMNESERDHWCLVVNDGQSWGWAVRRRRDSMSAMNRKGQWVYESRGSGSNRFRRWPLDEALALALKHVDAVTVNGRTAAQAVEFYASFHRAANGHSSGDQAG